MDFDDPTGAGHSDQDTELEAKLAETYGTTRRFAGRHHPRYIEDDVPQHIISRTFQGMHLLRPCEELNEIILGVLGRALALHCPNVVLYAVALLSNHMHLQLKGPAAEVATFMRYVKGEIARRWLGRPDVPWSEHLWGAGYVSTALPTPQSQINCLRYILSQSVKENLVAKPTLWPGVHAAKPLLRDGVLRGEWFNSTDWTRKRDAESRKKKPAPVNKADYYTPYELRLTPIDPWTHLSEDERRTKVRAMLDDIEARGRKQRERTGARLVGVKAIKRMPFERRTSLPPQPWFEQRRRMICWADPRDSLTLAYVERYWAFQESFRTASQAWRDGDDDAEFPAGAFLPPRSPPPTRPPG